MTGNAAPRRPGWTSYTASEAAAAEDDFARRAAACRADWYPKPDNTTERQP